MRGPGNQPASIPSFRATSQNARNVPMSRTVVNPASIVRRALRTPTIASCALGAHHQLRVALPVVVVADQVRVHVHQAGQQRVTRQIDAAGVGRSLGRRHDVDDAIGLEDHRAIGHDLSPLGVDQPVRRDHDALAHGAEDTACGHYSKMD